MGTIAVVGSGAWGTALACHAAKLGHEVAMWALEAEVVEEINAEHSNSIYLKDQDLPENLRASSDPAEVVSGAEMVLLVPPSKYLRSVSRLVADAIPKTAVVAVASKGIEEGTLQLMSEVLAETMPDLGPERLSFLSGPSFAKEVARGLPTDVAVASVEMTAANTVQQMLHSPMFRVYTSPDPNGVQVGGAIKNVMAVATGVCDGLGFGTNARASLITRGLAEITRLGLALGADPQEYLANRRTVAEGFFTSAAAWELSRRLEVDMPITDHVFHVLHRGRPLREAVDLLLTRESKEELVGIRDGS
jgi:glycerol-3-phosphate dehydrogenase (NAD(P)+)